MVEVPKGASKKQVAQAAACLSQDKKEAAKAAAAQSARQKCLAHLFSNCFQLVEALLLA